MFKQSSIEDLLSLPLWKTSELLNEIRHFILLYEAYKNESFETNIWNDFHFSMTARNLKAYVLQNLTNMLSVKFNWFFLIFFFLLGAVFHFCGRSLSAFGLNYGDSGTTRGSWIGKIDFRPNIWLLHSEMGCIIFQNSLIKFVLILRGLWVSSSGAKHQPIWGHCRKSLWSSISSVNNSTVCVLDLYTYGYSPAGKRL